MFGFESLVGGHEELRQQLFERAWSETEEKIQVSIYVFGELETYELVRIYLELQMKRR